MVKIAKHWAFTINNYTEDDLARLRSHGNSLATAEIVGMVFGLETGKSGTPHVQGHISFVRRISASRVKRIVGSSAHCEIARNAHASWEYCTKEGSFEVFGTKPRGQGCRTDLEQVQAAIRDGNTIEQIQDDYFKTYARYPKAIEKYAQRFAPKRDWETQVIVLWGATGTGKTRYVFDKVKEERLSLYVHPGEQWFDGYHGQEVALFDDFNGSEFKLSYLLKVLDRYEMQVPVKGGYVNWTPKYIYLTSNKDPLNWYPNCWPEHKNALLRRITEIKELH